MDISTNKLFKALKDLDVDVEGTLSRFCDNDELYMKFLLRFPDEDRLTPIKDSISARNYEMLLQAAHKLKGTSANLGMNRLSAAAEKIVGKVRSGDYSGFEADYGAVEKEYNLICQTIRTNT
ncbi:MAG: Hpt domain-containing protein [Ruminococcus sp.]|nr:Hpt domain-containing protein [Ruminococcus sp.]MCM1380873.1 Hpt domain-containing protein [Muribaculaceae bacterium]MCM1479614.1 Hpt domain-containing protein [Muribaculaceae bacterium]